MRNFRRRPIDCLRIPTALLALLLTHCATSPNPQQSRQPATVPAPGEPATGARVYQIDSTRSLLQVLVYRGGKLAALGHNHVVASHDLTGSVTRSDSLTATRFDIRFPVSALTVDEPELRHQAGAEFQAEVPQNARDGTRRNMLSTALLDADRFAEIRLRAVDVIAMPTGLYDVGMDVVIKGQTRQLRVPVRLALDASHLTASGELEVLQSDLGLTPFTALLGALTVENRMVVRFQIFAVATDIATSD